MKKVFLPWAILFLILLFPLTGAAKESELLQFSVVGSSNSYVDITGVPGEPFSFSIQLKNPGYEDRTNEIFISDGYTADNGGTKILLPEEATRENTGKWINFTRSEITLKPGEEKRMEFYGTVPLDAKPGTHIAVLYLRSEEEKGDLSDPTQKGARFQLNRVYSLSCAIVIRIEGEKKTEFLLGDQLDKKWVKDKDLVLTFDMENSGNVYDYPDVSIELFDETNRSVYKTTKSLDIVYPDNRIQTDFIIPKDLYSAERYNVSVTVNYGSKKGQSIQSLYELDLTSKEVAKANKVIKQTEEKQKTYLISEKTVMLFFVVCLILMLLLYLLFFRKKKQKVKNEV